MTIGPLLPGITNQFHSPTLEVVDLMMPVCRLMGVVSRPEGRPTSPIFLALEVKVIRLL